MCVNHPWSHPIPLIASPLAVAALQGTVKVAVKELAALEFLDMPRSMRPGLGVGGCVWGCVGGGGWVGGWGHVRRGQGGVG